MDEQLIRSITQRVLQEMSSSKGIPIGVSARHVHLCREDLDILFGTNYELTFHKELMGGQFAATETVLLEGNNSPTLKARILGPLRSKSQVEVSITDSRTLGISPPLRDSGDIDDSEKITIIGPKGYINLRAGCIIARRHIHMSPHDAVRFGVDDNSVVNITINGARGGTLHEVLVRVDPSFTLEMHIDTDEANAFGISGTVYAQMEDKIC